MSADAYDSMALAADKASCTANAGTIKLSPGLVGTPAVQTIKIKGTLTGCAGEPFAAVKYTATLTTADPVSCSVLKEAGEGATGPAKYKWTPKAPSSSGTLGMSRPKRPAARSRGE